MNKFDKYKRSINNLGLLNFLKYCYHQKFKLPRKGCFELCSPYADGPLVCRAKTSDIDVFKHIFVLREYDLLDDLDNVQLVVDCGANAGFSTAYFLHRYRSATVVAIEPDPDNFRALKRNASGHGNRTKMICAGVWSRSVDLKLCTDEYGDGREWARSVRETHNKEVADVNAIDIGTVLKESGFERISLLKIDIEGSEIAVFSENYESWLPKVDCLTIELHGKECERVFKKALSEFDFDIVEHGGLTICKSRTLKTS